MLKTLIAAAVLALSMNVANAGLYCKVESKDNHCYNETKKECSVTTGFSYANAYVLEYHWPNVFPDTTGFEYEKNNVICFVNGGILYSMMPMFEGVKRVPILENGPTQGPFPGKNGEKVGVVIRGDDARFVIDNLRSIPKALNGLVGPTSDDVYLNNFITDFNP